MRPLAAILVLIAGCALPLFTAWAQRQPAVPEKELIAVLDLKGVQASEAEVAALTDRLREVLLKTGRFTLVDRSQMDAILEEQAFQQTACTEQECAVQVGRILGVRKIVAGKIVKVSDQIWLLSALLVDVETAETLKAESIRHRGDYFALMDEKIRVLGEKLAEAPRTAKLSQTPRPTPVQAPPGMVRIEGGEFQMGGDGEPVQTVRLSGFLIDESEVTQQDFQNVMKFNPSRDKAPNNPVEKATWFQAQEYCKKVGKRLPTEAEWEYAARAGTTTKYSFGKYSNLLMNYGNYCGGVCAGGYSLGWVDKDDSLEIAPVKKYKPNPWGIHDMHGNVAEWVNDWYGGYQGLSENNPTGPESGNEKVVRGGSWKSSASETASAFRDKTNPSTSYDTIGFRCAANAQ